MKLINRVFSDKGNRFVFLSFGINPDEYVDEYELNEKRYEITGKARNIAYWLNLTLEPEWITYDDEAFPHVSTEIFHRSLAHGGATVALFAGPLFDKILAENNAYP